MLAHQQLVVRQRRFKQRHVVARADVAQHDRRVPRKSPPFRTLHWRIAKCGAELLLIYRQEFARKRSCILACKKIARLKCRLRQCVAESNVPRAPLLGDVSAYPYCASASDGDANAKRQIRRMSSCVTLRTLESLDQSVCQEP